MTNAKQKMNEAHSDRMQISPILYGLSFCILHVVFCASFISADEGTEFFETKIRPVLVDRCYSCHSANAKKLKGELISIAVMAF